MVGTLQDVQKNTDPTSDASEKPHDVLRVLHIDDDAQQLVITKRYLEELDPHIRVESIASSEEALLKYSSFDCIVSDYIMPKMNGIELAQRIREKSAIPFILYTGQGSEEVAEWAFVVGVDDYIRKEFDSSHYQVLVKRINIACDRYQAAHAQKVYEERLQSLHLHAAELNKVEKTYDVFKITYQAMDETLGFEAIDVIKIEDGILSDVFVKGKGREPFTLSVNGTGVTARAARTGETQYVPDVSQDTDYVPGRSGGMRSEFAVPILVESEAVAVLNVESEQIDAFTSKDRELLETLAFHMSSAFTRLLKYSDRRIFEKRLEMLHNNATKLVMAENIAEVAENSMEAIGSVLGFRQGSFAMVEDDQLNFIYVEGLEAWEPFSIPLKGLGITVRAIKTGLSQLVSDISKDKDFILGPGGRTYGSCSELDVPIIINGESVGVINLESERLDAFSIHDQILIETLAMHVSSAISRLKQLETLEKLVEEKTQEILDAERLVAAGRIASMVGHDLRGPLQTINNAIYLLEQTPKQLDEYLDIIKDAVKRSIGLLEEMRNRTRSVPVNVVRCNLKKLIHETVKGIHIPESVRLDLKFEKGLDSVQLDPMIFRRLLENLVMNALDAMPDGGVLTFRAGLMEEVLLIKVSDTGVGIPEVEMNNLFRPFYTTKGEGSGLGLAFCKRAVDDHGGTIQVESEIGVGTTFIIMIPVKN